VNGAPAALLALALAAAGCGGVPENFTVTVQSFGVELDCAASPQVVSVTATVVLDGTGAADAAHVTPLRARFDILGHSLRVPLDGAPTTVMPGESATVDVAGDDATPGDVCSACGAGMLAPFVVPTFVFHVNGARVEALPPPSALVCN
jgi:hypothetical protein